MGDNIADFPATPHEMRHLYPSLGVRSPEIKAPNFVLLDCGDARGFIMPFPVLAEDDPSLRSDLR